MSLLPYALRPKVVLRGQIVKRGVIGGNPLLRPVAMLMVGQGVYLRRSAIRQGLIGGSRYWRVIGVGLVGQEIYRQVFRKKPERIAVERVAQGRRVVVTTSAPRLDLSRRQTRAELARLEAEAMDSISASKHSS